MSGPIARLQSLPADIRRERRKVSRFPAEVTALIRAAIERLAQGAAVRIATDNDEEGAGFAAIIEGLVAGMGRGGLAVERAVPVDAKDWNDVLRRRRESIGT